MKELLELIDRYVNMYIKYETLIFRKKDLHNKSSETMLDEIIYATSEIKLSISDEIIDMASELSLDDTNLLLQIINGRKDVSEEEYKNKVNSVEESDKHYYKYLAYNELKNYIACIKEERVLR